MPIISEKNPDPIINEIANNLLEKLTAIDVESSIDKELLKSVKEYAIQCAEKISFAHVSNTLPEHLDERTSLLEVLETVKTLEHVIHQLLPGRIKYIRSQIREIKEKNNSEILRFISDSV